MIYLYTLSYIMYTLLNEYLFSWLEFISIYYCTKMYTINGRFKMWMFMSIKSKKLVFYITLNVLIQINILKCYIILITT